MKELDAVAVDGVAGGAWISLSNGWIFISAMSLPPTGDTTRFDG